MVSYVVGNLTSSSTLKDRERLRTALMATPGVAHVTLTPDRGEVSISFRANTPVAREVLATTIGSAGFELRVSTARFSD